MKDITVVVQGAVSAEFTPICLKSIRKYLPTAHILLSTWDGTDVSGLDIDEVIFNKDPGAIAPMFDSNKNIHNNPNNINRQIVSTLNGLKAVKTKYALKIRTDFEIKHAGFLKYFDKYNKYSNDYQVFEKRVISVMGDKPDIRSFFVYDFLFFGLTKDLLNLFDIPLMTKEDAEWFYTHKPINDEKYLLTQGLFKYIPEQHIWMNCLAKKYPEVFSIMKDCSDVNPESVRVGELSFVNNFVCLDFNQYGVYPLKDSLQWLYTQDRWHMFHFIDWQTLYKKYCDEKYKIKLPFVNRLKLEKKIAKFKGHREKFKNKKKLKFALQCAYDCLRIFVHTITHSYLFFK